MKELLYIDLFCGAGGTSTGVERARLFGRKCGRVIACVNHDPNAIASHAANHPGTLHFTEDIRTLDLTALKEYTDIARRQSPKSPLVLWASLECTNFSKAKGGKPRDADSRTLAEHLFRYIDTLRPDYIYIENVEEFMSWGDVDEHGKPLSMDKGCSYVKWTNSVIRRGYSYEYRILNSADYGAYTSRKRFFGIFAKGWLPIVFPEPTHCKGGRKADIFHDEKPRWKAVREVLELNNEGESIFTRKKQLTDRTLERIYAGLIKFVAGGKDAFISRYNSVRPKDTAMSLDEPCGVVTTENRFATVKVQFLSKQFSGHNESKNVSLDEPSGTITCKDHHALVGASFIDAYYGNGHEHSIEEPAPVVRTVGHLAMVTSQFFANEYSGGGQLADINNPSPAVTTVPKMKLVSVERSQFLMNTAYRSKGKSLDEPSFTLVARMDKTPPYLISTEQGEMAVVVYDDDTPAMRRIKEFMSIYGIVDIKMRMLNVGELKRIMGFGSDYTLIGTQTEQKKFIGNAVEVNTSKALCEALAERLWEIAQGRQTFQTSEERTPCTAN